MALLLIVPILLVLAAAIGLPAWRAGGRTSPPVDTATTNATATGEPATRDVVDAIAEPVLMVLDGTVVHANAAALALLGVHILGEDARLALRHPGAAEQLVAADPRPIVLSGLGGRDGRWEMRVAPMAGNRRLVQLVDRSASHAAERTRVDFVANASHELRTPLASLLGYVETLRDPREPPPPTRQRFLAIMEDEARRMQRLIDDLISLSRIEAEQYRVPSGVVDLAELTSQVCRERRDAQDGRGADLVVADRPDGPATVVGDAAQLSQLVHNLVGNAMKYGRAGTPVTIAVTRAGAMWRLSVADHGDGVAPEHLPRLTERFFRVDTGRSRALGGTGLGLAIAKHVVERHRGRLDIDSVVGEGTTVVASLPATDGEGQGQGSGGGDGAIVAVGGVTKGQPD
ncbi:sensor histidine kinase [Sphingomonas bacterium]|uniref:sensor histidine kinase n=1 Tax=Sphingomonas bacterium TaxID=1895847 RepID=UPI0020C5FA49|nr:ATP-binding protein [Sphingomonas bacterium]